VYALSSSVITKKEIEFLKKIAPFEVVDYEDNIFKDWTEEEIKGMFKLKRERSNKKKTPEELKFDLKGQSYNFYEANPTCKIYLKNQGQCGSCWAFSSTSMLEQRYCVKTGGKVNPILSPQYLVSCDKSDYGCEGGTVYEFLFFLMKSGTVEWDCFPYTAEDKYVEPCITKCKNGDPMKFYKGRDLYKLETFEAIKDEIDHNGPVYADMEVYKDFELYRRGIYRHIWGEDEGGHAIILVGYGEEDGINYWIGQNSWGVKWGEKGFFRIQFGEVGIEDNVHSLDPVPVSE
jgi:cathepsin B